METDFIDDMEAFYADLILVEGVEPRKAIFAMVSKFPNVPAQDYILILCRVATIIEAEATQKGSVLLPLHIATYKFTAILALDILELQRQTDSSQTGNALIAYWRQSEEKLFVAI